MLNKNDLEDKSEGYFEKLSLPFVKISAKEGIGEEALNEKIKEVLKINELDQNSDILGSERQYQKVVTAKNSCLEALSALKGGVTLDAVGILIDEALSSLLELEGKRITTEVADEVFKNFCVGK